MSYIFISIIIRSSSIIIGIAQLQIIGNLIMSKGLTVAYSLMGIDRLKVVRMFRMRTFSKHLWGFTSFGVGVL